MARWLVRILYDGAGDLYRTSRVTTSVDQDDEVDDAPLT